MSGLAMTRRARDLFDIPDDVTYLNCAAMCPLPRAAHAAGIAALTERSRPWTIKHPDAEYRPAAGVRGRFARLIGARAEDIAIVGSSSYGVAVAAANLPLRAGETVVMPERQHQSNVLTWTDAARRAGAAVVKVPRPEAGDWTAPLLAAIDERTAVVAVPQCDWSDGLFLDLAAVGSRARAAGAALVVDGTQSIGALPFDVDAVRPDFLVCSTFKWLLGPAALALLYVAPHRQDGRPIEQHGLNRVGFLDPARHDGGAEIGETFMPGAERFDMGQRNNQVQLAQLAAGLDCVLGWGVPAIRDAIAPLTARARERARALGLASTERSRGVDHIVGLRFAGAVPAGLAARLAERQVFVSVRGGVLRISPHLYNAPDDIDRAFDALATVI